jgi:hypothetical protein
MQEEHDSTDLLLNAARQARAVGLYQLATALLEDALNDRERLCSVGADLASDKRESQVEALIDIIIRMFI